MAWVSVEKHPDGYAVITLAKEPVNSMDAKLWQQMYDAFMECENDTKVRGVIFKSGLKKSVFTAGLALTELYAPVTSEEKLFAFCRRGFIQRHPHVQIDWQVITFDIHW